MYTAKHAILTKEHIPDAQVYVFYIDIRAAGKNYEEFVRRAIEQYGATYLRGRVSRIFEKNGKLIVRGSDTLLRSQIEIEADMVGYPSRDEVNNYFLAMISVFSLTIIPMWAKVGEGLDWSSDDLDLYGLHANAKIGTFTVGGYGSTTR
jgi:hypothetical protein